MKNITLSLEYLVISPWRWLIAVLFPIFMAFWGWKKKSLNISGAISGKYFLNIRMKKKYIYSQIIYCVSKLLGYHLIIHFPENIF